MHGLDSISHIYHGEYKQALMQAGTTIILPTAIFYVIPSAALVVTPIIGICTVYSALDNMHSLFYLEYGNVEVEAKSTAARQAFIDKITDTIEQLKNIFIYTPVIKEEYGHNFNYDQSSCNNTYSTNANEQINCKQSDAWSVFLYKEASLHANIGQAGYILGSIFHSLTYLGLGFQPNHYPISLISNALSGVAITECVYAVYSFNSWSSKLFLWWDSEGDEDLVIVGDLGNLAQPSS